MPSTGPAAKVWQGADERPITSRLQELKPRATIPAACRAHWIAEPEEAGFDPTTPRELLRGRDPGTILYTSSLPCRWDNRRSSTLCARFRRDATVPGEQSTISAISS